MSCQSPKTCPSLILPQDGGSYALFLALPVAAEAAVGKLGTFTFPMGHYAYLGSARRGLRHRIARHLREEKVRHWHIDYFPRWAKAAEIWYALSQERLECIWASALRAFPGASVPAPGFGSSDCRCPSHLIHFSQPPSLVDFAAEVTKHSVKPVRVVLEERHADSGGQQSHASPHP